MIFYTVKINRLANHNKLSTINFRNLNKIGRKFFNKFKGDKESKNIELKVKSLN